LFSDRFTFVTAVQRENNSLKSVKKAKLFRTGVQQSVNVENWPMFVKVMMEY